MDLQKQREMSAWTASSPRAFRQSGLQAGEAKRELGPRPDSEALLPESLLWCMLLCSWLNYLGLLPLGACFQKQKLVNHVVSDKLSLCLHLLVITFVLNIISND